MLQCTMLSIVWKVKLGPVTYLNIAYNFLILGRKWFDPGTVEETDLCWAPYTLALQRFTTNSSSELWCPHCLLLLMTSLGTWVSSPKQPPILERGRDTGLNNVGQPQSEKRVVETPPKHYHDDDVPCCTSFL